MRARVIVDSLAARDLMGDRDAVRWMLGAALVACLAALAIFAAGTWPEVARVLRFLGLTDALGAG